MIEPCLLVAVSASIVFPPPGASEENGLPHTSARTQLPQSMKIMHEIMYKLEVLYVLCVLLMGRQRNQVGPSATSQSRKSCGRTLPRHLLGRPSPCLCLWPSRARGWVPYPCFTHQDQSDSGAHSLSTVPCCGHHF